MKELEGDPDDIFSIKAFREVLSTMFVHKANPFNSWEAIFDNLTIFVTFICGCYTFYLFCQTIYYVRAQSSLVDSHKYERYVRMSRDMKKLEI